MAETEPGCLTGPKKERRIFKSPSSNAVMEVDAKEEEEEEEAFVGDPSKSIKEDEGALLEDGFVVVVAF